MPPTDTLKTAPFREEHAEFEQHLRHILVAAREVPELSPEERVTLRRRILDFLEESLLPHAEAEEQTLYREVGRLLGNPWSTQPMIYDHLLIRRCANELVDVDVTDTSDLVQHLVSLYTLIRSHFEKEEQLYLPLLETSSAEQVNAIYERLTQFEAGHGRACLRE